jgi:uncharacterized protein
MWTIYDELISAVPDNLRVQECLVGMHWTLIRSNAIGMALTPSADRRYGKHGGSVISGISEKIAGMSVRRLAEFVKSWNPYEATLGLAAINSAINSPEQVEELSGHPVMDQPQISAFLYYGEMVRNKNVAVIGHFPDLDEFGKLCRLTILERNPGEGDLPDPACEYVLPSQDYVFITGTALINKTLPRLLELSRRAQTFLVGPSTPFAPLLFSHGIDTLAGTVVVEPDGVWQAAQEGAARGIFDHGARMVKVSREEWERKR